MKIGKIILFLLFCSHYTFSATPITVDASHKMLLYLHPDSHMLYGIDTITVNQGPIQFFLHKKCEISVTSLKDGRSVEILPFVSDKEWLKDASQFNLIGNDVYVVHWSGMFNDTVNQVTNGREQVADAPGGVIGLQGVYLPPSALFYPTSEQTIHQYVVSISMPSNWIPITTGLREKIRIESDGMIQWSFGGPYLLDGITIAAGQYQVERSDTLGIVIETCFSEKRKSLSKTYLEWAKKYIARYQKEIGVYPYPCFSMVEAFFGAGFGMPGFTFLGSEVIALPFIVESSLGHEVLHNWWGNGVFVRWEDGNWCEGLTTYGADWAYKEDQGVLQGVEYRANSIKSYASYVHQGNDFPLKEFTSRSSGATRAVGYNKSAFFFHTLKQKIGKEAFQRGLQRFYSNHKFQYANWNDLRLCFEETSGQSLGNFFEHWLNTTGAPTVKLHRYKLSKKNLILTLEVIGTPKIERLPIYCFTEKDTTVTYVAVKEGSFTVKLPLTRMLKSFAIDPRFDCWRMPAIGELPPTLSDLYGSTLVHGILAEGIDTVYQKGMQELATILFDSIVWVDKPLESYSTVVFFGKPEQIFQKKFSQFFSNGKTVLNQVEFLGGSVVSYLSDTGQLLGFVSAPTIEDIHYLKRKAPHYGKYSYIGFQSDGTNVLKGTWPVTRHSLRIEVTAF
ncbi:MAG: M1 family aminopeptidase [bacterium]|nr:M1 family aminopeptidase [bacterium]